MLFCSEPYFHSLYRPYFRFIRLFRLHRMASTHEIKVQWNSHHTKLTEMFSNLLDKKKLIDCTISVDGTSLGVHRLVLAACSPYFKDLFEAHPSQHPIIIMRDFRLSDI